jgi:hypothetical protein
MREDAVRFVDKQRHAALHGIRAVTRKAVHVAGMNDDGFLAGRTAQSISQIGG